MRRNIYDRLSERRLRDQERERVEKELADAVPPPPERFHTNELSFVRTPSLKDKTFHVFTLTDIGPSPFSLVVGRSQVEAGVDLETMAQQLLGELKKSLSHVEWIEPVTPRCEGW
ncbi:putative cytoplasmic protein [Pseudomonas sp. R3-18-08]|nr:DcrB-related protein [Pseudomonas sp. R3-18-08]AZF13706.1 putative cytoplasmic protein [Pseudomonas sp. R3-18-08]